jgi:nucleoside-diphosphate-sugar epimerase
VVDRVAFLTGGTGFVGSHVAEALLREGWYVRALARRPPENPAPRARFQWVPGDLSSQTDLAAASKGCQAIVHAAGLVKARTLEEYREVNLRGTQRLIAAARESSPEALFVLVSSQAAAGPAVDGRAVREEDPERPVSWYGLSKREGELAVAAEWKGPWIVLRPCIVYGPRDRGLLPLFVAAARGWVPVPAARSKIQFIAAEQVALAIARAAGRTDLAGRTGFLCDPEPVTIAAFADALARLPQRPARILRVPDSLVRIAGLAETLRETATRHSRPFNADKAREILAGDWVCDSDPMRRDLDLPPAVRLEDGLKASWDWYIDVGWLNL